MNKKVPLGKIIAERELIDDDTKRPVILYIGTPQCIADGWDYVCPYKIVGPGKTIYGHVHGVDALQTLQLVSMGIRASLESHGGHFSYLGNSFWQSGFPKHIHCLGGEEMEARVEKLITREETRWVAKQKSNQEKRRSVSG